MTVRRTIFALVREGTSDDGLIPHLRELLVRAGLEEVVGTARAYRGTVVERLAKVAAEETAVDIVFVHRDADGASAVPRRDEVEAGARMSGGTASIVIPVVPIQELEAWLLLDEEAIRQVAGRPSGRGSLGLPKHSKIELTAAPKEVLAAALLEASETTGRRRKEAKRKFAQHRRVLLERLDIDGPVRNLSAWRALEDDIRVAAADLLAR